MRACYIKGSKYIADERGQPQAVTIKVAPNVTVTTSNPDTLAQLTRAEHVKSPLTSSVKAS